MERRIDKVKVPKGAVPGHIIRRDGIPIGTVVSIQDDGRVVVMLHSVGEVANVPMEGEDRTCESCDSEKVFHDVEEKWVCPWCEL